MNEVCSICNQEKEMYYTPWCPRCDKPVPKTHSTLNLVQVLSHIRATKYPDKSEYVYGEPKGRADLWHWMCNRNCIDNDTTQYIGFASMYIESLDGDIGLSEEGKTYMKHIIDTFDLTEDNEPLWEISW